MSDWAECHKSDGVRERNVSSSLSARTIYDGSVDGGDTLTWSTSLPLAAAGRLPECARAAALMTIHGDQPPMCWTGSTNSWTCGSWSVGLAPSGPAAARKPREAMMRDGISFFMTRVR